MEQQLMDSTPEQELLYAIAEGQNDRVAYYLAEGVSPNALSESSSRPALTEAIEHENAEAVSLLLSAGADPNMTDQYGYTPLIVAIEKRCLDAEHKIGIIDSLIDAKADINKPGFSKQTPIMYAVSSLNMAGSKDVLFKLIESGADISAKNLDGKDVVDLLAWAKADDIINRVIALAENRRLSSVIQPGHSESHQQMQF